MKPLVILAGFIVAVTAQAQAYFVFKDTPRHNAMAKAAAWLKANGWLRHAPPDSAFAHPRFLRSGLAAMVTDTLKALPAHLDAERASLESQFTAPSRIKSTFSGRKAVFLART